VAKPKRIQGAFVSDKEVKKVVNWIKSKASLQNPEVEGVVGPAIQNGLSEDLRMNLEAPMEENNLDLAFGGDDPLYDEAKRVVIEAKKASASLLQRRLRIGYARAARLIDMLEENGLVGPGEGAKPREVFGEIGDAGESLDETEKKEL
jgi:S-DNA-T family DNA segregation ATPase FtsK/SpoIIIE